MSELIIGGQTVELGTRQTIELPIAELYTHTPITMPLRVLRGKKDGPTLFLSAAVHGDELNGVEIIRRVLRLPALKKLRGTILAVPVVNVHGLLRHSRYLPDRRDLNRSFPGSETGSVAGRLAHVFLTEIVGKADFGIDLHTGAIHRANLPQIRANLQNEETRRLAEAFGAPLLLDSKPVPGTLREFTTEKGVPVLLYESGEALRFDEIAIRIGVAGVLNVLRALEMLPPSKAKRRVATQAILARSSSWVRAPQSGVMRCLVKLGEAVEAGQPLALIADPFGDDEIPVLASQSGVVIGRLNLPLVHEGDAVCHVARVGKADDPALVSDYRNDERGWDGLPEEPTIV